MKDLLNFSGTLRGALDDLVQRIQSSLVVIHSRRSGGGAGFVWDASGLILTNAHVVGMHAPLVVLQDDRELEARLVAQDAEVDLALLEVRAAKLPAARTALSLPRIGEMVFAFGHPWGQRGYVSSGIVSALPTARTGGSRGSLTVIRTDAPLAPGNSGGPLVNGAGEVIGINSMIVGGDQSIAIPVSLAREFVQSVLSRQERAHTPSRPDMEEVF
jgi:serine protease Do